MHLDMNNSRRASLSAPAQRPSLPASFRSQLPMSMHSSSARDRTHALAVCHTYMTASFYVLQALLKCQMLHHRWHVMLLPIDSLILHVIILLILSNRTRIRAPNAGNQIHCLVSITYQIYLFLAQHNNGIIQLSGRRKLSPPPSSPFGPLPSPSPRIPLPSWDARHLVASLFLLVHTFSPI